MRQKTNTISDLCSYSTPFKVPLSTDAFLVISVTLDLLADFAITDSDSSIRRISCPLLSERKQKHQNTIVKYLHSRMYNDLWVICLYACLDNGQTRNPIDCPFDGNRNEQDKTICRSRHCSVIKHLVWTDSSAQHSIVAEEVICYLRVIGQSILCSNHMILFKDNTAFVAGDLHTLPLTLVDPRPTCSH